MAAVHFALNHFERFPCGERRIILGVMKDDSVHTPKPSLTDILFVAFLRLVAIVALLLGLQYWGLLVGVTDGGGGRFDLLNVPWRVAATALAVIFPVAGIGLWMTVSWGPVIWCIGALVQVAMYGIWSHIFGQNLLIIVAHAVLALGYIAFRLVLLWQWRQAQEIRFDLP